MSPTIFSAASVKKASRQRELEAELEKIKNSTSNTTNTLPAREAAVSPSEEKNTSTPVKKESESPMKQDQFKPIEEKEKDHENEPDEPTKDGAACIQRQPEDYSEVLRHESPTTNPLAAFVVMPPGATFLNQHSKEKILLVLRQHSFINVKWIPISLLLIVTPILFFPVLPLFDFLTSEFKLFAMIGWYLLVSAYMIEQFLYWYYNIYIITDERIVDIDFISLMYRQVSEAKIDKIEDVTATTTGLFAGIFNYGNVTIQTAAEKREFEFLNVPQPAKVTKFLNELLLEEEREKLEGRVM